MRPCQLSANFIATSLEHSNWVGEQLFFLGLVKNHSILFLKENTELKEANVILESQNQSLADQLGNSARSKMESSNKVIQKYQ